MKKFLLSLAVVSVIGAFSAASLQAQCTGCSGKDKKDVTKKEDTKKDAAKKS